MLDFTKFVKGPLVERYVLLDVDRWITVDEDEWEPP